MADGDDPSPVLGYPSAAVAPTDAGRLREVALLFTRLGFTAFGGPAVHTAMMEDEVVRRRNWLDRQHFLDLVSALNFIPGPNSTELAIHLGLIRAGFPGLLVAGACFILPAVLIILPMAWAYVAFGRRAPQMQEVFAGVSSAVVAILAVTFWRFARTAVTDVFTAVVAVAAAAAAFLLHGRAGWQPELVILAAAALAGAVWYGRPRLPGAGGAMTALIGLVPAGGLSVVPGTAGSPPAAEQLLRVFLLFLRIGATLFGSGYVLVSYLRTGLVEQHGWLSDQELLDAVAVGQVTPGPLLTTATFIGYVLGDRFVGSPAGGVLGALLATAAIFLPSFVFVALFGRVLPRIRANRYARGALDAMNAAVAALILVVTIELARRGLGDPFGWAVCLVSLGAMLVGNVNTTWLILGAGLAGLARDWMTSR